MPRSAVIYVKGITHRRTLDDLINKKTKQHFTSVNGARLTLLLDDVTEFLENKISIIFG